MKTFEMMSPPNWSNERLHWAVKAKRFKEIRFEVFCALAQAKLIPTENERLTLAKKPVKRSVKFTRFYGGRRRAMDFDGVASACKPVLDALKLDDKGAGLIFDDRPEWCAVAYDQVKDKSKAGLLRVEVS